MRMFVLKILKNGKKNTGKVSDKVCMYENDDEHCM